MKALGKNRIVADKLASLTWVPLTSEETAEPVIGMMFLARWSAEQFALSWTAKMGVQDGMQITQNWEALVATCTTCRSFRMGFAYQPSTGQWALRQFCAHEPACFGAPIPTDGATLDEVARSCKSAFTASQVARLVANDMLADANMNMAAVRRASSSCFLRNPSTRFFGSVKRATQLLMATDRHVDMAVLPHYADALRVLGNKVSLPPSPCT